MKANLHRVIAFGAILVSVLAACAPAATPAPTPTATQVVPTATVPPTATSRPTNTALPPHTATATSTATELPTHTPTATLRPTDTPTPGPGDIVYHPSQTSDWDKWHDIYFGTSKYAVTPDGANLTMQIDGLQTYVYWMYTPTSRTRICRWTWTSRWYPVQTGTT